MCQLSPDLTKPPEPTYAEEIDRVTTYASPLLDLPDAVPAEGVDAGVAAHYGNPFREQKTLLAGNGFVDLSHRGVVDDQRTGPADAGCTR